MSWFLGSALAYAADDSARPTDLSVTSLGGDFVRAETIDRQDANLLLGQRLRWALSPSARLLVDGRFSVDPDAPVFWEDSRVRELGVGFTSDSGTLLVGRHALVNGGPRLVDGAQAVANLGAAREIQAGAWAGLVPDEFTTAPTTRFGFGPILGWNRSQTSITAVGDLVFGPGGANRFGSLVLGRAEVGSKVETTGRLDWVFADGLGNSGLADGMLFAQYRPVRATRFDVYWDSYSSLLYQTRSSLDPTVQRFASRIEELGLAAGIEQDLVNPTLHHVLGGTFATHGSGDVYPVGAIRARTLFYPDPAERYTRAGGLVGVGGLAGERLELDLDANLWWVDTGLGGDAGVMAVFEPNPDSAFAIDGSARALFSASEFQGYPGWYADLFFDVVGRGGRSLAAGGSWSDEPSDLVGQDVGWGAFVRVQQWVRPERNRPVAVQSSPPAVEE
ncbi:MAG: hypothetical protein ABMA64_05620 [Myxococcota bacterium]